MSCGREERVAGLVVGGAFGALAGVRALASPAAVGALVVGAAFSALAGVWALVHQHLPMLLSALS